MESSSRGTDYIHEVLIIAACQVVEFLVQTLNVPENRTTSISSSGAID